MQLPEYISSVSKEAVIDGVKHIKRYQLRSQRILSPKNPLLIKGPENVLKHADVRNNFRIKSSSLNSFLAASSLAHLLDGWMYLSNAFTTLLSGDKSTTIHLAYYAELRSAMAILATEGIGVFNNKHIGAFSTTTNGEFPSNFYRPNRQQGNPPTYEQPGSSTHKFVWEAMKQWTDLPYKPNEEILKPFSVRGKNFEELTEYFDPRTSVSTLLTVNTIKGWLKEWCFDIEKYETDRSNRNEASYRPQRIKNFLTPIDFQSIINDLNKFWEVISPSASDPFNLLDKYLLRMLYKKLYDQLNIQVPKKELIAGAFTAIGINDEMLFGFLDYENPYEEEHIIFKQASLKESSPLPILARATLLLRVSVGLVSQLYKEGGISKGELNFVWNSYAIDNGFWLPGSPLSDFKDLWIDIETKLTDLKLDVNSGNFENSPCSIKQRNPEAIILTGQINRACLWGFD